jgi:hypothetical protein
MSDKKCSEVISDHLRGRETDLSTFLDLSDPDYDSIWELPLAIEKYEVIKVHLSFGGPSDWLEIVVFDSEILRVEYHFADWFDHADLRVDDTSPLYRYAEIIVESFIS